MWRLVGIGFLLLASPAFSGAWMRAEGQTFLSFSISGDTSASGTAPDATLYIERGFTPRLTFGLTAWTTETERQILVFGRVPLSKPEAQHKLAIDLSLGVFQARPLDPEPAARLGLSWGRDITFRGLSGWTQVEAAHEIRLGSSSEITKVDGTLGVHIRKRTRVMLQLFAEQKTGQDKTLKIAPSVIRSVGTRGDIVFGMTFGAVNDDTVSLNLGTWLTF